MAERVVYEKPGSTIESDMEWEQMGADDYVKSIREFIYDANVPEWIQGNLWSLLSKHILFANLKEDDERRLMRDFFNLRDKYFNSLCISDIDTSMINTWHQLKMLFESVLTRARGGRERTLGSMQIKQIITTPEERKRKAIGLFGRLFGFRKKERSMGDVV